MPINIFEPPFAYLMILGMIIGIGIAIFRKVKISKEIARYKGDTLNEVIEGENLKPYLKSFGRKTKRGKLITQMTSIPIRRIVKANFKYQEIIKRNPKTEFKDKIGEFIIFQSGSNFLVDVPIFSRIVGKSQFYVIKANEDNIIKDSFRDVWNIPPNNFFYLLGGVWINSDEAKDFITELTYKKTYENIKEEDMNYVKRIVWYNDLYASKMTSAEQEYDLEKKKWQDRIEGEVKG